MASRSHLSPPPPPPPPPPKPRAPPSRTTIRSLGDDLLLEIFLRLPSLPSLVRAALACRAFLTAVRSSAAASTRSIRPPILGIFFDYGGRKMPSFSPVRRTLDPDFAAVIRGADVFLTRVPVQDADSPGWTISDCRGGFLLLTSLNTWEIVVYNPLSRALVLDGYPVPCDEIGDGARGMFVCTGSFLLSSDEPSGSFRVVIISHDKSRLRATVFSSDTRKWRILPWSRPAPGQPSGKKYWLEGGGGWETRHVNGKVYWSHAKEAYQVVLDTVTLQFSFIDLPEHMKGKCHLYMVGEAKDGKPCIVSTADFTLAVWFRRADADGVEKWMLDSVIPLEKEVLQATKGSLDAQ